MIKTSEEQLKAGFWKVHRHNDNRYYLNLNRIISRTIFVDQVPPICKYCKAYPFQQSSEIKTKDKECQLCGSINQTAIKLQNPHPFVDYQWYQDHSYLFPLKNKQSLKSLIILCIDPQLDQESLEMLFEGLSVSLKQQSKQQYSVAILFDKSLGILNLANEEEPQMIKVADQGSVREVIQQNKIVLQGKHISHLKTVIQAIKSYQKEPTKSYHSIVNVISRYKSFQYNSFTILMLISSVPQHFIPFPSSSLYLIALFVAQHNFNSSHYLELKNTFHQLYFLSGSDQPTKLYYKIYEILALISENAIHRKILLIKSNQLYSGTIQNQPHGLISTRSHFIEVKTANNNPHCLQFQLQYFDQSTQQWCMLVANFKDKGSFRSQALQKCVLTNKTLQHIIHRFFQLRAQKKSCEFNYNLIREGIEEYKEKFQNSTNYMQGLLQHLQDYFKEFQKQPEKLIAPFEYMGTIWLQPVFWPILIQNRLLYYSHGFYPIQASDDEHEDLQEVQRMNQQILQRYYTRRSKKLHLFYRLCWENRTLTVLQKQID